ncbi:MAG: hypothetical protein WDN28_12925 [Chthoniobacter sp.]
MQLRHGGLGLHFVAHDADVDVGVLEVRRDIHLLDGDQRSLEGHLAAEEIAELALEQFVDAFETVLHEGVDS